MQKNIRNLGPFSLELNVYYNIKFIIYIVTTMEVHISTMYNNIVRNEFV